LTRPLLFAAGFSLLPGLFQTVQGQDLIVVALGNTQAPGLPPGTNFIDGTFRRQSVNTVGKVVFKAVVTGADDVIYFGDPGNLNLVAMEDQPAPGTKDDVFCTFDTSNPLPSMIAASDSKVAFTARVVAPAGSCSSGRVGIWVHQHGVTQLLALEGEQAADSATGVIYSDIRPKFRHANQGTIFSATLFDSVKKISLGRAILTGLPGDVEILALIGDPAPGQPGKSYGGFTNAWPHNNTGQSSFWSWFNAPGSDQGIYRGDTTLLELLWKSGTDASDFLSGYTFMSFGQQQPRDWGLNDAAHGCFTSKVTGPNKGDPVHDTVWRDLGASRAVLASTAFSDPGLGEDFEFTAFVDCWINKTGRVLLRGTASSTIVTDDRKGLWLTSAAGEDPALSFITSIGDTLFNDGEPFEVSITTAQPAEPHINRLGSVAFEVRVVNSDPPPATMESIWLSDGVEEQLLAHGGQLVTLDNQQQATLGPFLEFGLGENGSGNQDGNPSAISGFDQVIFNATVDGVDAILLTPGKGGHFFWDGFEDLK
jgi:hypothetical protein